MKKIITFILLLFANTSLAGPQDITQAKANAVRAVALNESQNAISSYTNNIINGYSHTFGDWEDLLEAIYFDSYITQNQADYLTDLAWRGYARRFAFTSAIQSFKYTLLETGEWPIEGYALKWFDAGDVHLGNSDWHNAYASFNQSYYGYEMMDALVDELVVLYELEACNDEYDFVVAEYDWISQYGGTYTVNQIGYSETDADNKSYEAEEAVTDTLEIINDIYLSITYDHNAWANLKTAINNDAALTQAQKDELGEQCTRGMIQSSNIIYVLTTTLTWNIEQFGNLAFNAGDASTENEEFSLAWACYESILVQQEYILQILSSDAIIGIIDGLDGWYDNVYNTYEMYKIGM